MNFLKQLCNILLNLWGNMNISYKLWISLVNLVDFGGVIRTLCIILIKCMLIKRAQIVNIHRTIITASDQELIIAFGSGHVRWVHMIGALGDRWDLLMMALAPILAWLVHLLTLRDKLGIIKIVSWLMHLRKLAKVKVLLDNRDVLEVHDFVLVLRGMSEEVLLSLCLTAFNHHKFNLIHLLRMVCCPFLDDS